jgi:hypothetical protein
LISQGVWQRLALESTSAAKPRTLQVPLGVYLVRDDDEVSLVVLDEIPGVRGKLVFKLCYESRGTVQAHSGVASQTDTQQVIETSEVIHVGVGNEYVTDAQELARWQRRDISNIEKDRAARELQVDIDARIAERSIDELRLKAGPHATENTICFDGRRKIPMPMLWYRPASSSPHYYPDALPCNFFG